MINPAGAWTRFRLGLYQTGIQSPKYAFLKAKARILIKQKYVLSFASLGGGACEVELRILLENTLSGVRPGGSRRGTGSMIFSVKMCILQSKHVFVV